VRAISGADAIGRDRVVSKVPYRGLIRALRRRRGAPEYWLKVIERVFEWTEAQPLHALHQHGRPASATKQ
jgi:hypothetical protein